ncbi:chromate transporter [Acetomicrobium sp. S15 = DSM 107314]|uniref:chromate transporter n=1 Tax=Acetomicrobium sp. S15 = DSM 107314 TaxID=2529858 RepID=UPI003158E077
MQLLQLLFSFFKVGLFGFGGGYAILPLIQREIVSLHNWLTMDQFIDIVAISQVTPGPVAINAATFVGYKVAGLVGSLIATTGVVLPPVIVILILTRLFLKYRDLALVKAMFNGIRPVVVSLILAATVMIVPSSITDVAGVLIAVVTFLLIKRFKLDPILSIALAAMVGILIYR